jgi:hypothetical protein
MVLPVRGEDLVCSLGGTDVPACIVALVAMMLDRTELLGLKELKGLAPLGCS